MKKKKSFDFLLIALVILLLAISGSIILFFYNNLFFIELNYYSQSLKITKKPVKFALCENTPVSQVLPILMYHKVDTVAPTEYWILQEKFQNQMQVLLDNCFTPIFLQDLYDYNINNKQLPSRPIILTFDDGYENFFLNAWIVLKKFNFKSEVFLITDYIGETNKWDSLKEQNYRHLSWPQIKEMQESSLVHFQSHTKTHPKLAKTSLNHAKKEIIESKQIIEQELGLPVHFFSYPYGSYNSNTKKAVQNAGYLGAVGVYQKLNYLDDLDMHALRRFHISRDITEKEFLTKIAGDKKIIIDISDQKMQLLAGNILIDEYIVSTGSKETPTLIGEFKILTKNDLGWSSIYQQYLPFSLQFFGDYLIHEVPYNKDGARQGLDQLGQAVSHGCVRLGIGDAEQVFNWADIGTVVAVQE